MVHTGRGDYFDYKATLDDGTRFVAKTADIAARVILEAEERDAGTDTE